MPFIRRFIGLTQRQECAKFAFANEGCCSPANYSEALPRFQHFHRICPAWPLPGPVVFYCCWFEVLCEYCLMERGHFSRRNWVRFPTFILWVLLVLMSTPAGKVLAGDSGADLKGVVKSPEVGVLTNASIFIYTAGPRLGAGLLCPSCYPDCRKSAKSGPNGEFTIQALSTNLLFRV